MYSTFVKDKKGAQWLLSRLCLSRDDQNRAVNSYRESIKMASILFGTPKTTTASPSKSLSYQHNLTEANYLSNEISTELYNGSHDIRRYKSSHHPNRTSVTVATTKAYADKSYAKRKGPIKGEFQQWVDQPNYVGLERVANTPSAKWSSRLRSPINKTQNKTLPSSFTRSNKTTPLLSRSSTTLSTSSPPAPSTPILLATPLPSASRSTPTRAKKTNPKDDAASDWSKEIERLASKLDVSMKNSRHPGNLRRFYLSVFKKFRELEQQNVLLKKSLVTQDVAIQTHQSTIQQNQEKVHRLEVAITNINQAATSLSNILSSANLPPVTCPRDYLLHGISYDPMAEKQHGGQVDKEEAEEEEEEKEIDPTLVTTQMIRQGLLEIFVQFDADNDGVMNCHEFNALRAKLTSRAPPMSPIEFENMCAQNNLETVLGGLTLNGFLDMYALTPQAASTDLNLLGITLGPLLFPRQALMEATRRLVEAIAEIEEKEHANVALKETVTTLVTRLSVTEKKVMQLENEKQHYCKLYTKATADAESWNHQLYTEKMNLEHSAQREEQLEGKIKELKKGVMEMHELLQIKAEEKEQIQRQMAEMLKEYNVAHAMARAAKTSEFQAKEKEKQLQRKNQVLHTTLKTRQNHYGRVGSTQTDKNMGDRYLYPNTHFSRRKKKVLKKNKKKDEGGGKNSSRGYIVLKSKTSPGQGNRIVMVGGSPVNGGGSSRSC